MDVTTVEKAVTTLQQEAKPVSVRAVHRLTVSSFRDIARHLKAIRLFPPPSPPTPQPQRPLLPAQAIQPRPQELTALGQIPAPQLSGEVLRALEAYWLAVQEYTARQRPQPGRIPMDRTSILVALQSRVEQARRRLAQLGIDPDALP